MTLTLTRKEPSTRGTGDDERKPRTSRRTRFLRHVALSAVGLVMMYPLLWMVSSSLKLSNTVFTDESLWPASFGSSIT